jgi:hypothetical protein
MLSNERFCGFSTIVFLDTRLNGFCLCVSKRATVSAKFSFVRTRIVGPRFSCNKDSVFLNFAPVDVGLFLPAKELKLWDTDSRFVTTLAGFPPYKDFQNKVFL